MMYNHNLHTKCMTKFTVHNSARWEDFLYNWTPGLCVHWTTLWAPVHFQLVQIFHVNQYINFSECFPPLLIIESKGGNINSSMKYLSDYCCDIRSQSPPEFGISMCFKNAPLTLERIYWPWLLLWSNIA